MPDYIKRGLEIYVHMKSAIDIVNVVASTKLADAFDLPKIEAELKGAEYNKAKAEHAALNESLSRKGCSSIETASIKR